MGMESHSCCICFVSTSDEFNLNGNAKYSRTRLHSLLKDSISSSFAGYNWSIICLQCHNKLNSFDELYCRAMEVKTELCQLIEGSSGSVQVKVEVTPFADEEGFYAINQETTLGMKEEFEEAEQNLKVRRRCKPYSETPEFDLLGVKEGKSLEKDSSLPSKATRRPRGQAKAMEITQCPVCGKLYRKRELSRHMKLHSDDSHPCLTCGKVFKIAEYLEMHKKTHEARPLIFCDICGHSAKIKSSIRNHILKLHTNQRDFLCSQCPKAYASAASLKKHMLFHNEIRRLACSMCEARFHTSYSLKRHMRSHGPRDMFSCEICKRTFAENYQLTTHMRNVHSIGKKKETTTIHTCYICTKQFDRPGKLRKHLVDSHEIILEDEVKNEIF